LRLYRRAFVESSTPIPPPGNLTSWPTTAFEEIDSNCLRFFPEGFSTMPRRISATVIEEMNEGRSAQSRKDTAVFWRLNRNGAANRGSNSRRIRVIASQSLRQ
jgi:hypothetical protein